MPDNYLKIKSQLRNKPHRFIQASADTMLVRFENNVLKEITSKQNNSFQLEVIEKGKVGTASSNFFDSNNLTQKALTSAQFGDQAGFSYPKSQTLPKVKLFSPQIGSIKPQEFVKTGQQIITALKTVDPKILVTVKLSRVVGNSSLNTSSGFTNQSKESEISVYAEGELVTEGDILTIDEYWGWRENNFNFKECSDGITKLFKMSKKIIPSPPTGPHTIVMAPEVLSNLLDFYSTALSAQSVFKKTSRWTDKLGQQVADSRVTLTDEPTIDFAESSTDSDDEGLPANPLTLIENGVLKNFYTNLKYAAKLKIEPNGRGFGTPSSPNLTNIILSTGDKSLNQIIKGVKNGILVEQVIGGGQDSPYSGDFSLNIHLGFLIKDGEVVGRIKDCLMSGNAFEMFQKQLGEIGSEAEWYGGSLKIPYVSFENVTVASKT